MRASYLRLTGFLAIVSSVTVAADAQVTRQSWITTAEAARHGLHRAFVTQVEIDRGGDTVVALVLEGDTLFAQSSRGVVQAIDAETGRTKWVRQIGRRGYTNLPAAANHEFLCVPRDTILYIVSRQSGQVVEEIDLNGAASGPTAMGDQWVYVPTTNGSIRAFPVGDNDDNPWAYRGAGLTNSRPLVTATHVYWNTLRGFVYGCDAMMADMQFEVTTGGPLRVALAHRAPLVFAASDDRVLYAIDESTGAVVWRLPLSDAPRHEAVVVGDDLFVVERVAGLSCIDPESGIVRWYRPGIRAFVSASADRVYCSDGFGRGLVLDRASGQILDSVRTQGIEMKYTNAQNDRLYLARPSGLIYCFHELGLTEPLVHRASSEAPVEDDDPFADGGGDAP